MSFTYDFQTAPQLSQVRLMIADTDPSHPVFSDDEVNNALFLESSQGLYISGQASAAGSQMTYVPQVFSVRRAAALLLDAIAANKGTLASISQLLDVKLNHDLAAQELRATAQALRDTEANAGHFAIAEMVFDQFSARERVWKQLLRLEGGY